MKSWKKSAPGKTMTAAMIIAAAMSISPAAALARDEIPELKPDATLAYVVRDSDTLLLDIYRPSPGAETLWKGKPKPAVLHVSGGGFFACARGGAFYEKWFRTLLDRGYPVVSIDYRLYMKNRKVEGDGLGPALRTAIGMAVEDLFAATSFLLDKGPDYGIDARNIVLTGGSAGAVTILQAEYELCNRTALASVLPEDFDYAGIMAFSGAIFPHSAKPSFPRKPCPILMLHGVDDMVVPYGIYLDNAMNFHGSDSVAAVLKEEGFPFWIMRYEGHRHEICGSMEITADLQDTFLRTEAVERTGSCVDSVIDRPGKPEGKNPLLPWLYDGKKH